MMLDITEYCSRYDPKMIYQPIFKTLIACIPSLIVTNDGSGIELDTCQP